jgi:uncharacterized protein YqgC (DUF456 family)
VDIAIWCVTVILLLAGLIGSVVPLLPGTTLILAGVLLQKWLLPGTLTWTAVSWIAAFWMLSIVVDLLGTILGTRLLGGSKWGMAGASGGALIGVFISLPALILGSILGAFAAEKIFGRRSNRDALRSGLGAALGFVISTVARLGCALVMVAIYVVAVIPARGV